MPERDDAADDDPHRAVRAEVDGEAARGQPRRRHRDRRRRRTATPSSSPVDEVGHQLRADHGPAAGHADRNVGVAVRCRYSPVIPMTPSTAAISTGSRRAVEHRLDRHPAVRWSPRLNAGDRGWPPAGSGRAGSTVSQTSTWVVVSLRDLGAQGDGHRAPPGAGAGPCWARCCYPGGGGGGPGGGRRATPPGGTRRRTWRPTGPSWRGARPESAEEQLLQVGPLGAQLVQLDAGRRTPRGRPRPRRHPCTRSSSGPLRVPPPAAVQRVASVSSCRRADHDGHAGAPPRARRSSPPGPAGPG